MPVLILGLVLFLGTHGFAMARRPRAQLIERFGEGPYKIGFTVLSFVGITLVSIGYGLYRAEDYLDVWYPPVAMRHLSLILVWIAFVMFVAAYLPGRIKATLKHPMLAGVKIWALAHLLSNGDIGSILLFGSFLAWAVAARISVKRRDEVRVHGGEAAAPAGWRNDLLAVGIGTAAYLAFAIWLHPRLIGVAVWPGT
jgi:uncharacterized membrane protein